MLLRCDRGTNFVGGRSELNDALNSMDQGAINRYVTDQNCEWLFNPPHASLGVDGNTSTCNLCKPDRSGMKSNRISK